MRLKPDGQDLRLDLRKRGGGAGTPYLLFFGIGGFFVEKTFGSSRFS